MPVYEYQGLTAAGKTVSGMIDADTAKGARLKLRNNGVFPTDLKEGGSAGTDGLLTFKSRAESISLKEQALLTRQLGTLLTAGLPLVDSLSALIDQIEKANIKGVMADIRERVREGSALSQALQCHPGSFSPLYTHMVSAGEASGALDEVLARLADFQDSQIRLKNQITTALMYPMFMFAVGSMVLFGLVTFVVPKITAVFTDMEQALPLPTIILLTVSDGLAAYWMWFLAGGVFAVLMVRRYLQTEVGRERYDALLLKLPVVGTVVKMVAVSRFTRTLSTMLSSGVPLMQALEVVSRVVNNRVLQHAIDEARQNIREGESLAAPLKRSGLIPPLATHMIAVGEKSGELEAMLIRVSQVYDSEVDTSMNQLTALLEPIMIVVMGVVVLFIILAILLPIFEMSQMAR
ncbi:MAG TPA: type II secretion system protein GspF [Nitrospirales bacterium]|nr:type II secretion system protein GspF [Nitrospirales bacterium]HIC05051.1 type II secretion system protein GspF [Nitrospirales bacterium]HIO70162.1 type II secretion system protein GspF [Nitrospirales bacterium]